MKNTIYIVYENKNGNGYEEKRFSTKKEAFSFAKKCVRECRKDQKDNFHKNLQYDSKSVNSYSVSKLNAKNDDYSFCDEFYI